MDQTKTNKEVETAQQALKDFGAQWMNYFSCVQQMIEENEQLRQRMAEKDAKIAKLEEALEQQKKDNEWSSRVTYEGVVEQIAACEDAKGAPLGYFLFGGSDCVLLFQKSAKFNHTAPAGGEGSYSHGFAHIYQGEQLGTIGR